MSISFSPVITLASGLLLLFLESCLLVSDNEIRERIAQSLPPSYSPQINAIEKRLSCIAATFTLETPANFDELREHPNTGTNKGLGKVWESANSLKEHVETIPDNRRRSTVEGTGAYAKNCMKEINVETRIFYEEQIFISRSRSGKEIIMIYGMPEAQHGMYLAQGR